MPSNPTANSKANIRQLELIAVHAKRITSTIRVDVSKAYVLLQFISHGHANVTQVQAGYYFYFDSAYDGSIPILSKKTGRASSSIGRQQDAENYFWRDDSIENCLRLLAEDWSQGTPDFDSITFETKKSPLEGSELEQLLLAVWLEAFDQVVPEQKELVKRVAHARQKRADLRAQCLRWLSSGPEGVKRWNDLKVDERKAVGMLGQCQFGGCDLRGAYFGNQDLRGTDFREARLQGAQFGGADCRAADFRGALLHEAWLSGGRFLQADFSEASLRDAAIRAADCRGAIFSGTEIRDLDLSFADLRQVDLSSATLDRAQLFCVKYDEHTKFPPGFVIDPELRMEWKGAEQRQAEYRTCCSLQELMSLIPPPPTPSNAEGDWDEAEFQMRIQFPSDFKQLICTYGSGEFLGDLWIYNPLTVSGRASIASELEILEENREASQYVWTIHPEESGLLPWGGDSNGNIFCWLARGEPDDWPTAQLGHGEDEPQSDDVNLTTFLFNYARNQYPEMQGGLTFEESDRKFTPR